MEINGKRTIITGASKGIGRAIAKALASEGADLFLTSRDEKLLSALKTELEPTESKVGFRAADLASEKQLNMLFSSAIDFLGGIDILINNAGIGIQGNVIDIEIADWEKMYDVNLGAVFLLSRLAAKEMVKQQSGYIINIGSGASQTPIAGFAGYCATKYGLLGFSESLGLELREHNIKVSIILPGSTATYFAGGAPHDKIAAKPGILRPEDIAGSVLYLLNQGGIAWTSILNLRPLNLKKCQP